MDQLPLYVSHGLCGGGGSSGDDDLVDGGRMHTCRRNS